MVAGVVSYRVCHGQPYPSVNQSSLSYIGTSSFYRLRDRFELCVLVFRVSFCVGHALSLICTCTVDSCCVV